MTIENLCICGSASICYPFSDNFYSHICKNCGSRNFTPKENIKIANFHYEGSDEKYGNKNYLYGSEIRWAHHQLLRFIWVGRKVLEVGCFNGFFINELKKVGAESYGYDLNRRAIEIGEELFSLKGFLGSSFEFFKDSAPFSDILCIDILEHLDHPESFLKEMKELLIDGGKIYISGPTIERGLHDKSDYPPHHKWWFSRKGLELCLNQCGYKVIQIKIQRNGALMLRNFIGRLIGGFSKKEFYGNGVSFSTKNKLLKRVYQSFDFIGVLLFTVLRIDYCSCLIVAERVE